MAPVPRLSIWRCTLPEAFSLPLELAPPHFHRPLYPSPLLPSAPSLPPYHVLGHQVVVPLIFQHVVKADHVRMLG